MNHIVRQPGWGAQLREGVAEFGLWAPAQRRVAVRIHGRDLPMQRGPQGWFSARMAGCVAGDRYGFVLEDGFLVPDPAARAQAGDVHGESLLVDSTDYHWRYPWPGRCWEEAVLYELHVGTFTPAGTFRAIIERLPEIANLGVTAIELMPVAHFPGNRGWGYDAVLHYAVHPAYGGPDDLRALVDVAHGAGLMVLLDVVYNHFGPEGNYIARYAPQFFHPDEHTPWGARIAHARAPVRRFFIENALYWLREFRLDGLRLDAVDHILDDSDPDILVELAEEVRRVFPGRRIHLTTEDNRNITHLHMRAHGHVPRYTAEWNDDWHHAAHVIATGESDYYYGDFADAPQRHLARALAEGFAFQGAVSRLTGQPRGQPSGHLPPVAFVNFLQNHDQIGNRAYGERIDRMTDDRIVQALHAILLLSPQIPLLFMGEEYAETRPFLFFADFTGELGAAVRDGRRQEFMGFPAFNDAPELLPDPNARSSFVASKLDWSARDGAGYIRLSEIRALLDVRAREIVPHLADAPAHSGRILDSAGEVVAVDWQLNGAILHLRANLSGEGHGVPPASGKVIWGSGDTADPLAPWRLRISKSRH